MLHVAIFLHRSFVELRPPDPTALWTSTSIRVVCPGLGLDGKIYADHPTPRSPWAFLPSRPSVSVRDVGIVEELLRYRCVSLIKRRAWKIRVPVRVRVLKRGELGLAFFHQGFRLRQVRNSAVCFELCANKNRLS